MKIFNHDIRSSGPASLGLGKMYASRALCITEKDDVMQLPGELKKHWEYIKKHYERVGLECCQEVIWDLRLEQIIKYPDAELSCFYFGERENLFRPNQKRLEITKILNSKNDLVKLAENFNIKIPITTCFDSKELFLENEVFEYPVYLKPSVSTSGLGIVKCEDHNSLCEAILSLRSKVAFQVQNEIKADCFCSYQFKKINEKAELFLISDQIIANNSHIGNRYPSAYENHNFLMNIAKYAVEEGIEEIFAFDVAVQHGKLGNEYFLIECNPRYTAASYPAIVAKKLNINCWMTLVININFDNFDRFDIKDLEFNKQSRHGVIIIGWGTIEYGRIMLMMIGTSEQQSVLVDQIKNRLKEIDLFNKKMIYLSPDQISRVTGGRWKNTFDKRFDFTGVNFYLPYIEKNDLFFDTRKKEIVDQDEKCEYLDKAFNLGAAIAVVRKYQHTSSHPVLEVEDPVKALQDMAIATSLQFDGIKIQVIGSHGKTGFKTQLSHLLKDQFRVHAHLDSSNLQKPVWRTLSAIARDAKVAIIETAIPNSHAGTESSFFVRPNYIVITGIGFEHLSSHKTLDNLIINKVAALQGLRPGGCVLINKDDAYYEKIVIAIKNISDCRIYTFGSHSNCDGYLISAVFNKCKWYVKANILGLNIEYTVPLLEDYVPLASVSILLMAKILGGDINQCALNYATYQHFESSGNLYDVAFNNSKFQVYDQSRRGEWKGFISMFELMSRLKPKDNGRKIAVISEFINMEDNPNAPIDLAAMKIQMANAEIDLLFTVSNFTDHIAALPENINWVAHQKESNDIHQVILNCVHEDDIIFVRGIEKARLDKLVDKLLKKGASFIKLF
ncbi:Mur ligase family protein [Rhodoferax sp.]|uniref:Mur ligase family protein n=1 Tax=Rhodoferax sp. TaxID=50421 RepID=UPI0026359A27|nr:Mur ligase family protein [Rhodoferax sp.]MDD2920337.1 Mur ligase family protein [Rhodoferax sp.]